MADSAAWNQAASRVGGLEDLLRRNEGSLGAALGRIKEVETALNTMHRALGRIGPDLSSTIEEMRGQKRRVDMVDQSHGSRMREMEGALLQEIRNNKPVPLTADPTFLRLSQDFAQVASEVQETIGQVRRLTDAVSADGKALRTIESDTRWLAEQARDQVAAQRDFANAQGRKNEQVAQDVHKVQEEIVQVDSGLRKIIDAAVKASREELLLRLDQESKARGALQADFVAAFGRMREDVIKGFTETATNLRNLDETAHSLETVLRAEVRSRMASSEEFEKRVEVVEERLRREALSAAEYLKALDSQMSAALRDVRDVSASECKSQLDTVWRSVDDLNDQVKKINGKMAAASQSNDEMTASRTKLMIETAVQDARADMAKVMESRIASATAEIEGCATKSELHELRTRLDLKLQEAQRRESRVKFDSTTSAGASAPEHGSSTATGMKIKKLGERLDDSEKQLLVVAEAVRDVHEELVEKLERVETQSRALDALQKSLQEAFDRDQTSVQEQTGALRHQLMDVMEEIERLKPARTDPNSTTASERPPTTDATGPVESTETPDRPPASNGSPTNAPSPTLAYSHRALEGQIHALKKDLSTLQHEMRRDVAECKTQQDQLFDRHVALSKQERDDITAVKRDLQAVSSRAQENAEQLSDRLHEITESTNVNFAKLNDDVAALADGKAPSPRRTDAPAVKPNGVPLEWQRRVTTLEDKTSTLENRVQKIEDAAPENPTKADAAPPSPSSSPPPDTSVGESAPPSASPPASGRPSRSQSNAGEPPAGAAPVDDSPKVRRASAASSKPATAPAAESHSDGNVSQPSSPPPAAGAPSPPPGNPDSPRATTAESVAPNSPNAESKPATDADSAPKNSETPTEL
jgi:uncharacterized phage infection (PIP) family protein YhgE